MSPRFLAILAILSAEWGAAGATLHAYATQLQRADASYCTENTEDTDVQCAAYDGHNRIDHQIGTVAR